MSSLVCLTALQVSYDIPPLSFLVVSPHETDVLRISCVMLLTSDVFILFFLRYKIFSVHLRLDGEITSTQSRPVLYEAQRSHALPK